MVRLCSGLPCTTSLHGVGISTSGDYYLLGSRVDDVQGEENKSGEEERSVCVCVCVCVCVSAAGGLFLCDTHVTCHPSNNGDGLLLSSKQHLVQIPLPLWYTCLSVSLASPPSIEKRRDVLLFFHLSPWSGSLLTMHFV